MVQLKSFRYLENSHEEGSSSNSHSPSPSSNADQQHSRSSASSSNSNLYSLASGGNLTLTGADEASLSSAAAPQANATSAEDDSTTTTLGSNEECQVASHEITEGEGEEEGEAASSKEAALTSSGSEPENSRTVVDSRRAGEPGGSAAGQLAGSSSLSAAKREFIRIQAGAESSPRPIKHSASSQSLSKYRNSIDSQSQYWFNMRNLQQNNSFEIRWHNINLYATKSSILPKFLTESALYKSLARNPAQASFSSPVIPSSPPMKAYQFVGKRAAPSETGNIVSEKLPPYEHPAHNNNDTSPVRTILNNVSGAVISGQLTAILGPSGVGKTTLLNSLTGRNTLDGTGRVLLLGAGAETKRMSVVTVPQADILPGKLTTLEDLQFTSRLKNPQRSFNHKRNIDRIVQHLHMEKFLNTPIDKLSGGEARRLSIGRELLSSPDIMILDEPTSGLDANTCKKIITALKDIVVQSDNILDRPMSIIVTIHQPQQEVFNLFHRVYVMAQGGRSIYEGPPTSLLPTFLEHSSINQVCPVDQLNENPAIVAIEVASGEFGPNVIDELALNHEAQMYEEYAQSLAGTPGSTPMIAGRKQHMSPLSLYTPRFSHLRQQRAKTAKGSESISLGRPTPILPAKRLLQQQRQQFDQMSIVTSLSYASTYDPELPEQMGHLKVDKRLRRSVVMKGDFLSHTWTLMERCWLLTTRDLFLMGIRVLGFLLVAGGMVQIFSNALDANQNQCPLFETEVSDIPEFMYNIKNRLLNISDQLRQASNTHLFFFHLILCITIVVSALSGLVFPMQMRMFIREYKNGWYSPASFITSLTFAELPIDIIGPTITVLISYPLCNQPASAYHWREAAYIVILFIATIITKSQAQIVGAFLMDSVENSVFMSCVMVTPAALLSGLAVRVASMSWPLQIMSAGSYLRYAVECLFVVRYGYDTCPCDPEIVYGYPTKTSADAIPPQLNRLMQGFIELNSRTPNATSANITNSITNNTSIVVSSEAPDDDNIFVKILRLVSSSGNQFVAKLEDLGDCSKYRSLYLIDMGIEDRILFKWLLIMLFMYVLSRVITYFVVKTVIKLRKG